jgi:hypothetical protein
MDYGRCGELERSYQTIGKNLTRVMNRLKARYRGWGIRVSLLSIASFLHTVIILMLRSAPGLRGL